MKPNWWITGLAVWLALGLSALGVTTKTTTTSTIPIVLKKAPATINLLYNGTAVVIDMNTVFGFKGYNGTIVRFSVQEMTGIGGLALSLPTTSKGNTTPGGNASLLSPTFVTLGNIDMELLPAAAPLSCANFLTYVNSGNYGFSIVHRVDTGVGIIQGGAFQLGEDNIGQLYLADIPTGTPVPLEYKLPNAIGTVAMARTSDPNSATSQWYINLTDNSQELGPANDGYGYTVFAQIVNGLNVASGIYNGTLVANSTVVVAGNTDDPNGDVFAQLPVMGFPTDTIANITPTGNATVIANTTSFGDPEGIGFDSNGTLYLNSNENGEIMTVTTDGNVSVLIGGGQSLTGLALDGNDNVYTADQVDGSNGSGAIYEVTSSGNASTLATGLWNPEGLAFDSLTGNLYVAQLADGTNGNGSIAEITPEGNVSTFVKGLNSPMGLAIDGNGTLYVTSLRTGTISKISPAGNITTYTKTFDQPNGVAVDSKGNIFIANMANGVITKLTPQGNVSIFYQNNTTVPQNLAFDAHGNLYASNLLNRVYWSSPDPYQTYLDPAAVNSLVYVTASEPMREFYATVNPAGVVSLSSPYGESKNDHISISPNPGQAGKMEVTLYAFDLSGKEYTTKVAVNAGLPNFTTQPPAMVALTVGGNTTLVATAIGPKVLPTKYAWYFNGKALRNVTSTKSTVTGVSGVTLPNLQLTNVQTSAAGNYTLQAANLVGKTTSTVCKITVASP